MSGDSEIHLSSVYGEIDRRHPDNPDLARQLRLLAFDKLTANLLDRETHQAGDKKTGSVQGDLFKSSN